MVVLQTEVSSFHNIVRLDLVFNSVNNIKNNSVLTREGNSKGLDSGVNKEDVILGSVLARIEKIVGTKQMLLEKTESQDQSGLSNTLIVVVGVGTDGETAGEFGNLLKSTVASIVNVGVTLIVLGAIYDEVDGVGLDVEALVNVKVDVARITR